uniref:Ectonucleoside triphosphate diphosphohydrolase 8 n=1 Tax=Canis lupus dingo TaxID=286419 RepID=A0A8C0JPV3_CANLU
WEDMKESSLKGGDVTRDRGRCVCTSVLHRCPGSQPWGQCEPIMRLHPSDQLKLKIMTPNFGVVFDAGSTHTSLFVYRWPADKQNSTGVVSQALACQVKGPGISSYASDPAQAGESLQGCLEEALVIIPQAKHQETPAFLGATAGMRLLSQKNGSQATAIFAAVSQALGRSPLDFRGAELLTGQDEGAFGWITINYVLGRLVQVPGLTGTLVGALDMGGASTQITFVPRGPILDESSQATFRLYGSEHRVYTHSYLCFGHDQMLTRLLAQLVQVGLAVGKGGAAGQPLGLC